jgi:hypothetical protein
MILHGHEPTEESKPKPARTGQEADLNETINHDHENKNVKPIHRLLYSQLIQRADTDGFLDVVFLYPENGFSFKVIKIISD